MLAHTQITMCRALRVVALSQWIASGHGNLTLRATTTTVITRINGANLTKWRERALTMATAVPMRMSTQLVLLMGVSSP